MTKDGSGAISVFNSDGKDLVSLNVGEGGSGAIITRSAQGKPSACLGSGTDGAGMLVTFNAEGEKLVSLGAITSEDVMDGTGMVAVFDPTGRTRRSTLTTNP